MNDDEKQSLKENNSFDELCEMYSNQPSIIQSLKKFHKIWGEAQWCQNLNIKFEDMDIEPEKMGTEWDFDCILEDIKANHSLFNSIVNHLERRKTKIKKLKFLPNEHSVLVKNQESDLLKRLKNIILIRLLNLVKN